MADALEHSDTILYNVHNPIECAGRPCTIHNRTEHHMRSFPQHWRSDRNIMERICPHGIGHPDPDSPWANDSHEWIHGCDGCCLDEDIFALTSATDRRKRSPVGTVYNNPERIFPVTEDVVKRLRSITTAKLANAAADEIERLESQVQMLAGLSRRLLAAGDALHAAVRNHDLTEAHLRAWEEARRG